MTIKLNNIEINVLIIRKKIKNLYFRFDDNLNLVVSANKFINEKEIYKLIEKNSKSLEKMLSKVTKKLQKSEEFWYLGNKYDIIFNENIDGIDFQDGKIFIKNKSELENFMKLKTKEIFVYEVNKLKEIIKTPNFALKIRKMKTRWGVCNYKLKTITLNSELIKYNKDILKYVIVHEMCHFYHHNHGPLFWNMVEKYYPNYKEARKELRE